MWIFEKVSIIIENGESLCKLYGGVLTYDMKDISSFEKVSIVVNNEEIFYKFFGVATIEIVFSTAFLDLANSKWTKTCNGIFHTPDVGILKDGMREEIDNYLNRSDLRK